MQILGAEILAALKDRRQANPDEPDPVHLVVPDKATADVLVSIADNLAGIELSRLRWERDKEMGRPALTFNGEEAADPAPRSAAKERTAVSFLLEEDRARALIAALADRRRPSRARPPPRRRRPGGQRAASRLPRRVGRGDAGGPRSTTARSPTRSRPRSTRPGARLTNRRSDAIHEAFAGDRKGDARPAEPARVRRAGPRRARLQDRDRSTRRSRALAGDPGLEAARGLPGDRG